MDYGDQLQIEARRHELDDEVERELQRQLEACPDLAFAHLPQGFVPGQHPRPELVLFVWFLPGALRSLRSALNLVSEAVARALPDEQYLDVVVLNSAPELLDAVERAGCLLVERDPAERRRALAAAAGEEPPELFRKRPWWRFGC
jgi:hypothetical protein